MKILVIHGPNLNLLGLREPEIYGHMKLEDINQKILEKSKELGISLKIVQYSSEGDIIDEIHSARNWADGIVINPGAYTHYSIAIRDSLSSVSLPTVEVHISNVFKREEFRHKSVVSPVVDGVISGLGYFGYLLAIEYLVEKYKNS